MVMVVMLGICCNGIVAEVFRVVEIWFLLIDRDDNCVEFSEDDELCVERRICLFI